MDQKLEVLKYFNISECVWHYKRISTNTR